MLSTVVYSTFGNWYGAGSTVAGGGPWGLPLLYVSNNFKIWLAGSLPESREEGNGVCDSFIMLFLAVTIYACRVSNVMRACS
jgi:hypothetical protein